MVVVKTKNDVDLIVANATAAVMPAIGAKVAIVGNPLFFQLSNDQGLGVIYLACQKTRYAPDYAT